MMSPKAAFLLGIALLSSAALLQGCGGGGGDDDPGTIPDIAGKTPELSTLDAALTAAKLVSTLEGKGPFTVFAPSNDAFNEPFKGAQTKYLLNNIDQLTEVLKYHVTSGAVMSDQLSTGEKITMLNNATTLVTVSDGTVKINDATVTKADVKASNGVVHIINKVLIPDSVALQMPDIPGVVTQQAKCTKLVAAVTAADLGAVLSSGPLTLFAPTDDAFAALDTQDHGLLTKLLKPENKEKLQQILKFHVLSSEVTTADLKDGEQQVTTLEGEDVDISKIASSGAVQVGNGENAANVVLADQFAVNGVVHLIDKVLVPKGFVPPPPTGAMRSKANTFSLENKPKAVMV